ncbi:MAG TPA: chemotaxis protein CheW [Anaeromyxobacter sp.]|nr:chemotaxis protein CheW [Anaeromyxobacter sp.]
MITPGTEVVGHVSTPGDGVPASEDLVVVRAGAWRFLLPIRFVRRIHPAALPTARPAPTPIAPVIAVEGELLPVAFAASLAGAAGAALELAPHHQLVELAAGERRGLLWVDAAEDVVAHEPAGGSRPAEGLVAGWSGAERPLPILDVPRLLELLSERR